MKRNILLLLLLISGLTMAQTKVSAGQLYHSYENYKEPLLTHKRFKHSELTPLFEKIRNNSLFNISIAGTSVQGREINLITAGKGGKKIFMWSQMHGDEPTATMAIFDIFNFLSADDQFNDMRKKILDNTTLYFLPMVNPDGAEVFKRRNLFDIDLNRDASRNTTPEARTLKEIFDYLKADFGFNLHDQSIYYAAGRNPRSAAISFLAPAGNYEKSVDSVRQNAMKLISHLHDVISEFIPGHIGKYSDDHEPRAFGDNFQKWGTSTILIETGGWLNDPDKQFLRKINFLLLLSAMNSIADGSYKNADAAVYDNIPFNEELLKDLVIRNVLFEKNGIQVKIDFSVDRIERRVDDRTEFYSVIDDVGDLSVFYGYEDYDFSGYEVHPGKVFTGKVKSPDKMKEGDFYNLLRDGYTNIIYDGSTEKLKKTYALNITKDKGLKNDIGIGHNANFYLTKNGIIEYVFVNGFMYDIKNRINKIHNSYIKK